MFVDIECSNSAQHRHISGKVFDQVVGLGWEKNIQNTYKLCVAPHRDNRNIVENYVKNSFK